MKKYVLEIGNKEYSAEIKEVTTERAEVVVNGQPYSVKLKEFGSRKMPEVLQVQPLASRPTTKPVVKPKETARQESSGDAEGIRAPLPGLILEVLVKEGDRVTSGQNIVLMEAMKMENQVQAPYDGEVHKIHIKPGETVDEEQLLVEIRRSAMAMI